MAAVGELEKEYEGRVRFELISAEETQLRGDEIEEYGFAEQLHGLVGFDSSGEAVLTIPGHSFGKEEVTAAVEELLGG